MKSKQIHWLAQNYKNLFSVGIVNSTGSILLGIIYYDMMSNQIFPYRQSPFMFLSWMTITLMLGVFVIIMTVYNYKYLLKQRLSEPHPRKQTFLVIWESLCLCVNIFLFVFSLM